MTYIKRYGKRLIFTMISIIISLFSSYTYTSLFIVSLLYYFNLISPNINKILKIIIILVNIFISSFILGKSTTSKGYLEGIKLALILIPIFILTSLITSSPLKLKVLIYYIIIFITSILGSMIGINRKKES